MRGARWAAFLAGVVLLAGVAACQPVQPPSAPPNLPGSPPSDAPQANRPSVGVFPSDTLTVPDPAQATGKRVNLPLPDCAVLPSDCNELKLVNELDGFDLDPNIALLFDGPIDVSRVTDASVNVAPTAGGAAIGLNRLVWDPGTNTLYGHPKQLLAERTEYRLSVTGDVNGQTGTSTFTTMSATRVLDQMREQLDDGSAYSSAGIADPALHFDTDSSGDRAVYAGVGFGATPAPGVVGTRTNEGSTAAPSEDVFSSVLVGDAGFVGFGSLQSPSWLDADRRIPETGTATGAPAVQGAETVGFVVITPPEPLCTKPAGGWPVAIWGPGFTRSKYDIFLASDETLNRCMATIAIDPVGHAYGPDSSITLNLLGPPPAQVDVPAHGRGFDQNGNGDIQPDEGVSTPGQPGQYAAIALRDGLRQTVADNMALLRAVQQGVDVDGAGGNDLSPTGITYFGQSFGGIYGTMLVGTDPQIGRGALNVGGGPILDIARLSPAFRDRVGKELKNRQPSIYNGDPADDTSFQESAPLYSDPPVTDPAPGAIEIQRVGAVANWLHRSGSPESYAARAAGKDVLYQFAYGDETVSNPTNATLMRAGGLQDRTTLYRHDKVVTHGCNPHGFLIDPRVEGRQPAQIQVATFLAGGGIIDPDLGGPIDVFEVPIVDPSGLETLNFDDSDCPLSDVP